LENTTSGDSVWRRGLSRPRRRALVVSLASLTFLSLLAGAFVAGSRLGANAPPGDFTVARWNADLAAQRDALARTRAVVDDQLGTLAARVGQMQAQLLRLDALGRHLTELAKLDRGEFDFDHPPALGGPRSDAAGAGPVAPDLEETLDAVGEAIDDRHRQLTALQNLILTRELARQIVPGGRPVESGYISSLYGRRTDPFDGKNAFHAGLDFAGAAGSRVLAVADGIVSHAGPDGGYGRLIEITHGNGYVTRYAHNAKLLVERGETVRRGDPIALMGSTGRSTGTHLHFEVLRDGRSVNPLSFVRR